MPVTKNVKYYIGIDIGKEGAIVIANSTNNELDVYKMPKIKTEVDYVSLFEILSYFRKKDCHVVFEKLQGIFGTGKKATWSLAEQSGHINAFCIALNLPYTPVPPKQWQKEMFQGVRQIKKPSKSGTTMVNDTKAMALIVCKRIFPHLNLRPGRLVNPHDGIVDAALLSAYCRRKIKNL